MNTNKRNKLCAVLDNAAGDLIANAALLRHYDECQEWAKSMVINNLWTIVAAAAFFGVTTKNKKVKDEMKRLVEWFNDKEQKPCKTKK
jgi:hypothetical protein